MAPRVDGELCNLCGNCVDYCPEDVLRIESDQVVLKYPDECWNCGVCKLECPTGAVYMVFPLDNTLLVSE